MLNVFDYMRFSSGPFNNFSQKNLTTSGLTVNVNEKLKFYGLTFQ